LRPARHLHLLQNEWTTEVAIDSTWRGDFYTVLHAGLGDGRVMVTLVDNPMIGWIWGGGAVATVAAIVAMWPVSRRRVEFSGSACDPVSTSFLAVQNNTGASAA
jgi:cytochrome c-type biogenesis protein CcmF